MLEIIVLAAGRGTRMHSTLPKVLHPIGGRPLLEHVLATARALDPDAIHVVVGSGAEQVAPFAGAFGANICHQVEQLGTAHAVSQVAPKLKPESRVLILFGDVPLLTPSSLKPLTTSTEPQLLITELADPSGYGRVIVGADGTVERVVEHKDASVEELRVRAVNTGVMAVPAALLQSLLPQIGNANAQSEYYLPDLVALASAAGYPFKAVTLADAAEAQGINDRAQQAEVERYYQLRQANALMRAGVTLVDPARIDIRGQLHCGRDCRIDINCVFEGDVQLADGVTIGANCVIANTSIGSGTVIHPFSHIDGAVVGARVEAGPYARLRPGAQLADQSRVGNFVEIKNAVLGQGSKVNHLSYVGDAEVGQGVNIGAGTITCNYDGARKHRTIIGDRAFIGSNTALVAPVEVGPDSTVGAGSTITQNVGSGHLAVGRARQRNIDGWQRPKK